MIGGGRMAEMILKPKAGINPAPEAHSRRSGTRYAARYAALFRRPRRYGRL